PQAPVGSLPAAKAIPVITSASKEIEQRVSPHFAIRRDFVARATARAEAPNATRVEAPQAVTIASETGFKLCANLLAAPSTTTDTRPVQRPICASLLARRSS